MFIRYDDERALALTRSAIAAGTEGWGVLVSPTRVSAPAGSRAQERLRAALAVLMSRSIGPFGTAVIDDRFGREIPTTASELVDVAMRRDVRFVRFDDRELFLDADARARLVALSRVRLGPAVDRIDSTESGDTVLFKRYREPLALTSGDAVVVRSLSSGPTVADMLSLRPVVIDVGALRRLEAARVITISADLASLA